MPFIVVTTVTRVNPADTDVFTIVLDTGVELICTAACTEHPETFFCLAPRSPAWPDYVQQAADDLFGELEQSYPDETIEAGIITAWFTTWPTIGDENIELAIRYGAWGIQRTVIIPGRIVEFVT